MTVKPSAAELESPTAEDSGSVTLGVVPSGSGYRAVVTRDAQVIWSCAHVHFTEHSARNCRAAAAFLAGQEEERAPRSDERANEPARRATGGENDRPVETPSCVIRES